MRLADRPTHVVTATARLNAHPRAVYDTIANYRTGYPRILPKQFSGLTVEQGGVGAGTVITFNVRLLGRSDTYRAVITEPEPGRVLVEKNTLGNDACTTFVVDGGLHPNEAVVTIRTELTVRRGWIGAIEQVLTTRLLHPMYEEELKRLEAAAREPDETAETATV
jgi:Polyketide cyclase / dehydrase and lipid transport